MAVQVRKLDRKYTNVRINEFRQAVPFMDSMEIAFTGPNGVLRETSGLGHRRILANGGIRQFSTDYVTCRIATSEMLPSVFNHNPNSLRQVG
jgi:hypothetical protein